MRFTQIFLNIFLLFYSVWLVGRIFLITRLLPLHDPNYDPDWIDGILGVRKFILNDALILLLIVIICVSINIARNSKK